MEASKKTPLIAVMKVAALEAARKANEIRDANQMHTEKKPDQSIVTAADRAAQECIESRLVSLMDARFLGEESNPLNGWHEWLDTPSARKGRWWVVDPIDGTQHFAHKSGPWAVSIALQENDVTRLGVVYRASAENGHDGKLYWAECGKGAFSQDVVAGEPVGSPVRLQYRDRYPDAAAIDTPLYVGHFSEDMPDGKYTGKMLSGKIRDAMARVAETLVPGQEQHPALCACANALSVVEGTHCAYLHGVHFPWDSAAIYCLLKEAGYPVAEYHSPTQKGILVLLTANSTRLFDAANAEYSTASPASSLSANALADAP